MKIESAVYAVSGALVLVGIALAHWVSPNWVLLAALVGLDLVLSAFTGFCVLETALLKLGVGEKR